MQCKDCYYYMGAENRCSLNKEFENLCESFSRRVDTTVKVSLDTVLTILGFLRRVELDNLELCLDSSLNPKNHERDKLLLLASELIGNDFTKVHPEFFQNYLHTLQPFMFRECIRLQDIRFCGYKAYIFDYPCGTHDIQIKVFIKDEQVDVISFHKSGNKFSDIRRNLKRTSEYFGNADSLVCLQESFDLYLAWEKIDDITCSFHQNQLWSLSVDDFIEQFQQKTLETVKSMLTDLTYKLTMESTAVSPKINKISIYTTLPISELIHSDDLTDRGLIAALLSARLIADMDLLDSTVINLLSHMPDIQELNEWLNRYHLFDGDIQSLLLKGE